MEKVSAVFTVPAAGLAEASCHKNTKKLSVFAPKRLVRIVTITLQRFSYINSETEPAL
jgi:hypothetical protein